MRRRFACGWFTEMGVCVVLPKRDDARPVNAFVFREHALILARQPRLNIDPISFLFHAESFTAERLDAQRRERHDYHEHVARAPTC